MPVDFEIDDLLDTKLDDIVEVHFPAGRFIARIDEVELLPVYWAPNEKRDAFYGRAIVPTISIVDRVPDGDPELDEEQVKALEAFGDWRGYRPPYNRGKTTYNKEVPGFEEKLELAGVSPLNFVAMETNETFNKKEKDHQQLTRFYNSVGNSGEPSGFVVDVVSSAPDRQREVTIDGTNLKAAIQAIQGGYVEVTLEYVEDRRGGDRPPRLEITAVNPVE